MSLDESPVTVTSQPLAAVLGTLAAPSLMSTTPLCLSSNWVLAIDVSLWCVEPISSPPPPALHHLSRSDIEAAGEVSVDVDNVGITVGHRNYTVSAQTPSEIVEDHTTPPPQQ